MSRARVTRWVLLGLLASGVSTAAARAAGYRGVGSWTLVRCHRGHHFTTLWIPFFSLQSVRLGPWRVQWCPVGRHLTLIHPVRDVTLDDEALAAARQTRSRPIP